MRLIGGLSIAAGIAAVLAASAEQAPPQPVFRSGVELVTIDVVATTRDGQPIHNLKASDFELFEDGVRQDIRTFEFINFSSPPPLPPLPPGLTGNEIEPGGIFTVVLDEIGIQVDDVQAVRRAAQRFFDETLQPNDHVAVVRSGVNSGFFLTNDRALAIDAIAQSTGRRERTLGLEAPGGAEPEIPESPSTVGELGLTAESKTYQVRFGARALNPEVIGLAFATVRVPEGSTKVAECGGFVFEQRAERDGLRVFTRSAPITISTLVSAKGLDGTVSPLSFALGPAGGIPQKTWPVQLGIPLANGLWRVALTLRAPLPSGNLEIQLLNNGLLLHDNCLAQFSTR